MAAAAAAAARDEPFVVVDRAGPAAARRHRTGIPLRCVNCLVHHHGLLYIGAKNYACALHEYRGKELRMCTST